MNSTTPPNNDNNVSVFIWTRAICCAIAIGLSAVPILASTKLKKSSRNVCRWLIIVDAITVLVYCAGGLVSLAIFLAFAHQIPLANCVPYQLISMIGFLLNRASIFAISLDRLLSVIFPVSSYNKNRIAYLIVLGAIGFVYTAINLYFILNEDFSRPKLLVWCAMGDLFQSLNGPISQSIIAINSVSLLFYMIIWYKIRQNKRRIREQKQHNDTVTYTERMFRSLAMIMVSIFFGYISTSVMKTLIGTVHFTPQTEYILTSSASLLSVITSGAQPLMLYAFSKEYRVAINRTVAGCMMKLMANNTQIQQMVPTVQQMATIDVSNTTKNRRNNGTNKQLKNQIELQITNA